MTTTDYQHENYGKNSDAVVRNASRKKIVTLPVIAMLFTTFLLDRATLHVSGFNVMSASPLNGKSIHMSSFQSRMYQNKHEVERTTCFSKHNDDNDMAMDGRIDWIHPRQNTRRSFVTKLASLAAALSLSQNSVMVANADTGAEVRGTKLTPFNGLAFQYRGSEYGGLQESDLNPGEPSISYEDFISRLKAGDVAFVEFMAPSGDAAYVTFKSGTPLSDQPPIRIGVGYPVEQPDGWSSPAFAVRAVQNAGVPYKFTVPALRSINKK